MKVLSEKEYTTFEQLARLNQPSLKKIMSKFLKQRYPADKVIETDAYLIAEGDIPIALVAHLDTVFKSIPVEIFYDTKKNVIWSPTGLGADDRAGVFAIVQILRSGLRPHIIFTTDEEIGGVGASILAGTVCPFKDLRYMIQLDRRGANDCVFYDCNNLDFVEYIEKFGFVENFGSFSDISFLAPEWGVAAVNLSVGYMDEHSMVERLYISHLLNTIQKVKKMLTEKDIPLFQYIPAQITYTWMRNSSNKYWQDFMSPVTACSCCGKHFYEDDMYDVVDTKGDISFYCQDCAMDSGKVDWCVICGNAFEVDPNDPEMKICRNCYEEAMHYNG